jgi:hypothetical protein
LVEIWLVLEQAYTVELISQGQLPLGSKIPLHDKAAEL